MPRFISRVLQSLASIPTAPAGEVVTAYTEDKRLAMRDAAGVAHILTPNYRIGAQWYNSGDPLVAADANIVFLRMPMTGRAVKWSIITSDGPGSCEIDVWKALWANYPPIFTDSITATKPSISAGSKAEDTTFAGWTTRDFTEGDAVALRLVSSGTFTMVQFSLELQP